MLRNSLSSTTAVLFKRLSHSPLVMPVVLLGPGMHLPASPVVGSRSQEYARLSHVAMHNPLLREMGYKIYDIRYRLIIPANQREQANQYSRELFLDYIKPYRKAGITEENIVRWVMNGDDTHYQSDRCNVEKLPDTPYVDVSVEVDNGRRNESKGYFFPPHLVAFHEVMHAEEYKKNLYKYTYGLETITTVKTILLLDEVNKKIKGVDLAEEINYRQTVRLSQSHIPLGCFANFYRAQEKKHKTLGDALASDESLAFLASGVRLPERPTEPRPKGSVR
jgi:hypothetical protein